MGKRFECFCKCCLIEIEKNEYPDDAMYDITLYNNYMIAESLWYRVKTAFKYVFTGRRLFANLYMTQEEFKEFKNEINKL